MLASIANWSSPTKSPSRSMSPNKTNDENVKPKKASNDDALLRKIAQLENEIKIKDSMNASLNAKVNRMEDEMISRGNATSRGNNKDIIDVDQVSVKLGDDVTRRVHEIQAISHTISDDGRIQRKMGTKILLHCIPFDITNLIFVCFYSSHVSFTSLLFLVGTRGSVATANVLEALPDAGKTREETLAERFLKVFQNPDEFIPYLSSEEFADDLALVCASVCEILESEPRCSFLQSPVYVIGDIHGNLEDLHFFADNVWKLGMDLTAGKFLFLGKYDMILSIPSLSRHNLNPSILFVFNTIVI